MYIGTLMFLQEPPGDTYYRFAVRHGLSVPAPGQLNARFRDMIDRTTPIDYSDCPLASTAGSRIWICIYIYIFLHVYIHICTRVFVCVREYMCVCVCVYVLGCDCVCVLP